MGIVSDLVEREGQEGEAAGRMLGGDRYAMLVGVPHSI